MQRLKDWNDPDYLKGEQYKNDGNLSARQRVHQEFSTGTENWAVWLWALANLQNGQKVLDAGCGNGQLWTEAFPADAPQLEVTLLDLSRGMVQTAVKNVAPIASARGIETSAIRLPFPDAYFDRIFANHMLYHVPNPAQAIAEFSRVLKPSGTLMVALNGHNHMRELWDLTDKAFQWARSVSSAKLFSPEDAIPILQRHFKWVALRPFDDNLRVTSAELLWRYVLSTNSLSTMETDAKTISSAKEKFFKVLNQAIQTDGYFYIQKESVAIRCQK